MRIRTIPLAFAALILPVLLFAQEPRVDDGAVLLSLEQRAKLRCAAAFALIARQQSEGRPSAQQYPPLAERGLAFFVRAGAQVMKEAALSRDGLKRTLEAEARSLGTDGQLEAVMPACLLSLEVSGLAPAGP